MPVLNCVPGRAQGTSAGNLSTGMEWTTEHQRWLEESCRASGVPLKVSDPETLEKIAVLLRVPTTKGERMPTETRKVDVDWARELIAQGYHVEAVVKKTGVPVEMLKSLVGPDGYRRGGS